VNKTFPPSYIALYNTCCSGYCCCGIASCHYDFNLHTWGSFLLPFMEATTVYNRIDQGSPLFSPWSCCRTYTYKNSGCCCSSSACFDPCAAKEPMAAVIPAFTCPSAPRNSNPFREMNQCWNCCHPKFKYTRSAGASDYRAINTYHHCISCAYGKLGGKTKCRAGLLICPSCAQSAAITPEAVYDGTQTTILFSELAGGPDLWTRGVKQSGHCGGLYSYIRQIGKSPCCAFHVSNPGGCWACFKNASNYVGGSSFTGQTKMPSGTTLCCIINCSNEASVNFCYAFHPGSAGIAMADGSAHQVSENISLVTFCNLVSYRGREAVTDNF
jgi:hypothetical protein